MHALAVETAAGAEPAVEESAAQMWQSASVTPDAWSISNRAECRVVAATRSISPTSSLAGSALVCAEVAARRQEKSASSSAASAGSLERASLTASCTHGHAGCRAGWCHKRSTASTQTR
eukprot:4966823-Prymnesium_polylepis.2